MKNDSANGTDKLPQELQQAVNDGLLKRFPLTFLPFVNQQLRQWEFLFPNERQSVQRLLFYVAKMSPQESAELFKDILRLEDRMQLRRTKFSDEEQTVQNSSLLARSPLFQEWRRAVQAVFDEADRYAIRSQALKKPGNRLVLLDIPRALPLDKSRTWRRWQGIGKTVDLDLSDPRSSRRPMEFLLGGIESEVARSEGILRAVQDRPDASPVSAWVLDAGRDLVESILPQSDPTSPRCVLLSYARLDGFRQSFSHEMNTMRKDLADADAVFDRLRTVNVRAWCPPEVVNEPAIREFMRSLYLSGNGAVIFNNSFVEWGASEAIRRARPMFLAARFGARAKPKAFTGVAVFDNPDEINPTPAVDDVSGSAVDAEILALYVWLAASRYPEYQSSTVCVCLAESVSQAYVIAPDTFDLDTRNGPVTLAGLQDSLCRWVA
ncbi:MAG: hypothetical protein WCC26_00880 [Terracidiphilus sp.]